jgi:hypothetical protein
MNQFYENLKHQAEENPALALGVVAAVLTGMGQLIGAVTDRRNSLAWAKEVDRRIKQSDK